MNLIMKLRAKFIKKCYTVKYLMQKGINEQQKAWDPEMK